MQIKELIEQITFYEAQVKTLIANAASSDPSQPAGDSLAPRNGHGREEGDDGGTDDDDEHDEVEDRFIELEEDLANVIADVHDLGTSFLPPDAL